MGASENKQLMQHIFAELSKGNSKPFVDSMADAMSMAGKTEKSIGDTEWKTLSCLSRRRSRAALHQDGPFSDSCLRSFCGHRQQISPDMHLRTPKQSRAFSAGWIDGNGFALVSVFAPESSASANSATWAHRVIIQYFQLSRRVPRGDSKSDRQAQRIGCTLKAWYKINKNAECKNFADQQNSWKNSDVVGRFAVFDISHNWCRLIATIKYRWRMVTSDAF